MRTSLLIPVYNGATHLAECLASTTEFDEVILWDDGSTDDSLALARRFPHVQTIHSENQGVQRTRNLLFEASTGEVIAYLDADDCRLPGALAAHLQALGAADGVFSPVQVLQGDSLTLSKTSPDLLVNLLVGFGGRIQTGGLLWRRRALETIRQRFGDLWQESLPRRASFFEGFLVFRALQADCRLVFSPVPAAVYRVDWSPDQFTADADGVSRAILTLLKEVRAWIDKKSRDR